MPRYRLILRSDGKAEATEVYYGSLAWAYTALVQLETLNKHRVRAGMKSSKWFILDITTGLYYKRDIYSYTWKASFIDLSDDGENVTEEGVLGDIEIQKHFIRVPNPFDPNDVIAIKDEEDK